MFHGLPIVTHDLLGLARDVILVLPAADMAVEAARLYPCRFEKRRLRARRGNQNIGALYGFLRIRIGGGKTDVREEGPHLVQESLLFVVVLGGDPALLDGRNRRLQCDEVHLRLLARPDEADALGVTPGEMLRGDRTHRADTQVRAERSVHERDREASLDL